MIRRLAALGLAVAVELAALSAPFVHVHADDHDTDHHAAHAVHTHLAGHTHARHDHAHDVADDHHATVPAGHHEAAPASFHDAAPAGPVVEGESEHTRFIQLFSAIEPASFVVTVIPPAAFVLPAPAEAAAHRPIAVAHGHDPPSQRLLPSRAPPLSYLS